MGLFDKNANETAFVGGKKHFADVIKNTGSGDLLIWRQPEEDFNTNSTLIVMPGEVAIFLKGGTVEQVFDNGTYKLSTENYPFISRLRNAMTGGVSTFNCVVYFVKVTTSYEILWGTDSPLQVRDKMLGIATKVKARGSYRVKIDQPVVFLEKLIGSNVNFETQEQITLFFSKQFQSKIKSVITRVLVESNTELLGIEARLEELSETIEPYMQSVFSEYGITCLKFVVAALDIDDDVLRRRYDEIGMDAWAKMRNAQADRVVMDTLGNDWAKLQAASILGDLANNPGAGGMAAMGAGVGMGVAAGGVFGSMASEMFAPMSGTQMAMPREEHEEKFSSRYYQEDMLEDDSEAPKADDPLKTLEKLKRMLDSGLIDQARYDEKVDEVLARI